MHAYVCISEHAYLTLAHAHLVRLHVRRLQVIEANVCRRLVELLMHPSPAVLVPALRTVGNIVTGNDIQTQIVISCGVLPCLMNLLINNLKRSIKKEACWTLSNITAGTKEQIQAVFDANLVAPLVKLLATAEYDIKKEAAWAISNATSGGTADQIKVLVDNGCIRPMYGGGEERGGGPWRRVQDAATWHGMAWHGMAWHGMGPSMAWHGMGPGMAARESAVQGRVRACQRSVGALVVALRCTLLHPSALVSALVVARCCTPEPL
eukprot:359170-Chlamydomonas_euryale.AAC.10